jgi:hypothetical protein
MHEPASNPGRRVLLAVLPLVAAAQSALGAQGSSHAYSPDITIDSAGFAVADEDAVIESGASMVLAFLGSLPGFVDLDGLHGMADGDVLFSLTTNVALGGAFYRACDVIRFDGSTWSKALDCAAAGIPANVDVDAVAESAGTLLFSIDIDAELDGALFSDADIIAYTGNGFSTFTSAASIGIDASLDVDALHIDPQSRLLVSFDTAGEFGGIQFRDEDVLAWNEPGWSLVYDGSAGNPALVAADIDAWSVLVVGGELIFSDGFE